MLLALLLCSSSALAEAPQPDYTLTLDRNPWLTSNCAAAITTFIDTVSANNSSKYAVSKAGIYYRPLMIDVASVIRLSSRTVLSGRIAYSHDVDKNYSGSTFHTPAAEDINSLMLSAHSIADLTPFDIIITTPGKVKTEEISLAGAVGWQASKHLSLGAKAEYTVASTARLNDLRYSNFRMNLAASSGIYYAPGSGRFGAGLSLYYRRAIQAVAFSVAGTTDIIHTSLIDYANGLGVIETFSGDGFTDTSEQPLCSDYIGFSAQAQLTIADNISIFIDALYANRKGYYGKLSQYTIRHTGHRSNCYSLHGRLYLRPLGRLFDATFIDARLDIENLTNRRTNYLSETIDGVTSYIYFAPTKTASKVHAAGHIALDTHIGNCRLTLGSLYLYSKQTAWLYPQSSTATSMTWTPFATAQYNFKVKNRVLITPQIAASTRTITGGISLSF